jgi:type II secretory pathway pseudopilin PulG
MPPRRTPRPPREEGWTLLELLLALAVSATLTLVALPLAGTALDSTKTMMAARYLESRIAAARLRAVSRSASVGFKFDPSGPDHTFTEYADGNANGVRTADIAAGVDVEVAAPMFLRDGFSGVRFGLMAGIPDIDNVRAAGPADGIRLGSSRILSLGPDGSSSSGTVYLHGRTAQYAVRILGATGRARVLRFEPGTRQWIAR